MALSYSVYETVEVILMRLMGWMVGSLKVVKQLFYFKQIALWPDFYIFVPKNWELTFMRLK